EGDVSVDDTQSLFGDQADHLAQDLAAVDAIVARVAVRKVTTDVAQTGGTEKRIAQRMDQNIAVRVRDDAAIMRNSHAAEHDVVAGHEAMCVVAVSDQHAFLASRRASAIARSSGQVTLTLVALPGTSRGR